MSARKTSLPVARLAPILFRLFCGGWLGLGRAADAQSLEETQRQFLRGHYAEVITTAQKKVDEGDYRGDWRMLLVKSLLTVGRYGEAYTNASAGLNHLPGCFRQMKLTHDQHSSSAN